MLPDGARSRLVRRRADSRMRPTSSRYSRPAAAAMRQRSDQPGVSPGNGLHSMNAGLPRRRGADRRAPRPASERAECAEGELPERPIERGVDARRRLVADLVGRLELVVERVDRVRFVLREDDLHRRQDLQRRAQHGHGELAPREKLLHERALVVAVVDGAREPPGVALAGGDARLRDALRAPFGDRFDDGGEGEVGGRGFVAAGDHERARRMEAGLAHDRLGDRLVEREHQARRAGAGVRHLEEIEHRGHLGLSAAPGSALGDVEDDVGTRREDGAREGAVGLQRDDVVPQRGEGAGDGLYRRGRVVLGLVVLGAAPLGEHALQVVCENDAHGESPRAPQGARGASAVRIIAARARVGPAELDGR